MRILVIDPMDLAEEGPWANQGWHQIVDLGQAGAGTYEQWSTRFACPVHSVNSLRHGFDDSLRVRELLGRGQGQLVDEHGLDWWEIMSLLLTGELEAIILLQRFVRTLSPNDEVHVSRPGFQASVLRFLLG